MDDESSREGEIVLVGRERSRTRAGREVHSEDRDAQMDAQSG